jgi:hypothetical protein
MYAGGKIERKERRDDRKMRAFRKKGNVWHARARPDGKQVMSV